MVPSTVVHDPLTGALGRGMLMPSLHAAIEQAQSTNSALALLIIDLDHFKTINDAFGHLRGDQILAEFVNRVRALGHQDDIFRYGGDEFVLILRHATHDEARLLARRLCEMVRSTPFGMDDPISITLTIGCASLGDDATTALSLFDQADQRLLAAKRAGRNRVFSDDVWMHSTLGVVGASRFVERETAYASIQTFLNDIQTHQRGQLTITGIPGVGRSALLDEACQRAMMRGYRVLKVRAGAGLRLREYGALHEALHDWTDIATSSQPDEQWCMALRALCAGSYRGLIIAIDDVHELDQATLDLLRDCLRTATSLVVGLIITMPTLAGRRSRPTMTRYTCEIELAPWSVAGVGIWLRSALHWEPPIAFQTWLHGQTGGLPAAICRAIPELIAQRILIAGASSWTLDPLYATREIAERLANLRAPRPHNLSTPPMRLVGRARELQQIKGYLDQGVPVTLVGPGGIGKTRLAVQAATEVVEHYEHGAWFVSLADITSVDQMVYAIAAALHIPLTGHVTPRQHLLDTLRRRRLLLVVDNLEHLHDGVAVLEAIVTHAPTVQLLLTSREPTMLRGEVIIEVEGLSIPAPSAEQHQLSSLSSRLFKQIVEQRGEVIEPEDYPYVNQICRLVGGMPLGIELAAAWIKLFTCQEIASQLAEGGDLLHVIPHGKQRGSLRGVFDYFWRQLSTDEQRVVRKLGVFRGGFDREAASRIAGASPFLLAALVDKAFLLRATTGRYSLHKLLQQYAESHLDAAPEDRAAVHLAHAAYYDMVAERAQQFITSTEQVEWLDRLEAEHDNFRTALAWARDNNHGEYGVQLVARLGHFWRVRGHCSEGRAWIDQLWKPEATPSPASIRALRWAGVLAQEQGDYELARASLEQYVSVARHTGDNASVADGLGYLGWITSVQGDYERANALLREGLELARQLDEPVTLLHLLNNLGEVTHRQGDDTASHAYYTESLGLARAMGDRHEISESLLGLGNAAHSWGKLDEAQARYEECLNVARALNQRRRIGESLGNLALIAFARGDYIAAQRGLQECKEVFESIGGQLELAMAMTHLGSVSLELDDEYMALQHFRSSIALAFSIGATPTVLEASAGMAKVWLRNDQPERARQWLTFIANHAACPKELRSDIAPLLPTLPSCRAMDDENETPLTLERMVAEALAPAPVHVRSTAYAPWEHPADTITVCSA
jgi:diguanylate cyclase (GGDEF)-like protein